MTEQEREPDEVTAGNRPWRDASLSVAQRVESLVEAMTLEEKVAQLYGVWVGAAGDGGDVAPHQHEMSDDDLDLDELLPFGLGQLTRPFGTAPIDPMVGAVSLMRSQQRTADANRFGIPAIAHEECLAGFAAWGATVYPVPLAWGATFDPELVQHVAHRIGRDMRMVGIHQGLAPVLDVVRDLRWGRVEETIGEDPYLVGTIATAYVAGLQSAGVIATLKHFVGYSASRAGRNLAPVSIGARELADVLLPPFEMAVQAGVRSVMNAYTDIDGIPTAADRTLLTDLLRQTWGFDGTVVADYFSVAFLRTLHRVADSWAAAAATALTAGIDVELPTVKTYREPLLTAVADGLLKPEIVDTALRRVLRQKIELGLLEPDWTPMPEVLQGRDISDPLSLAGTFSLDPPENRALALQLAERAVVLVRNEGILPLTEPSSIAVIGPNANDPFAMFGCYSFPAHIGTQHPDVPLGIATPTVLAAVRTEFTRSDVRWARGTSIDGGETDGIAEAVRLAANVDVVILALGDRAGLFGRGTSGEGCDAPSLRLPGAQQELLEAVLATGTPTVVALLAGRPYALGSAPKAAGAIVQTFFAGEEGGPALAGVLSGRVEPSGRLPVGIPATPDGQPGTYLAAPLARATELSTVDPTSAFGFGHGLSYTSFDWSPLACEQDEVGVDGSVRLSLQVTNSGDRAGTEVVQFYLHDPVATVVLPVRRLIGYTRVDLAPGACADVQLDLPADLASFTGRHGTRIVEPGEIVIEAGRSSTDIDSSRSVLLVGVTRVVDHRRRLQPDITVG